MTIGRRGIAITALLAIAAPTWAESDGARLERLEQELHRAREKIDALEHEVGTLRKRVEAEPPAATARTAPTAPAEPPAFKAGYKLGKGITVESTDGWFDATIGNRFQGRYTFTDQDEAGSDDTSTFRVRRMKTSIKGHVFRPDLAFKLQVNWADSPELEDALLHFQPHSLAGVMIGQYKVPFSRQQLTSSGSQQFVDRAITDDFFSLARDQGVTYTGSWFGEGHDLVEWAAGIFNGNGLNRTTNENSEHLGAGRVTVMPLGAFEYLSESDVDDTPEPRIGFGAGGAYNAGADSTADQRARIFSSSRLGGFFGDDIEGPFDVTQATADVHAKYRGASALFDWYWADADPDAGPARQARGWNAQLGYFVLPKRLEAAFRWAQLEGDTDARRDRREIGGALGWFFLKHSAKVQLDVRDLEAQAPGEPDAHTMEYRAQVQLIF